MRSNSFCELTGREAFTLVGKYLVRAFEKRRDLEAREGMMLAAATWAASPMSGPIMPFGA
jgi:alcohol dehydrogenase class IV